MSRLLRTMIALMMGLSLLGFSAMGTRAQGGGPLVIVPKKADPNQTISFSFQQADIDDILRFLADASGKMVFKDSTVSLALTIRNQSRIKVAEAIRLVQNILALKGYALVETEDALIVTTAVDAQRRRSAKFGIGKDLKDLPVGKEIVTWIFPLQTIDAVRLQGELQPLFPQGSAILIANSETNSLIVIDEADNIRRVALLINQVDKGAADEITVEVIRLKYAESAEVARYLSELFRPETQGGGGQGGGGGFPGGGGGFPGGAAIFGGGMGGMGGGAGGQRGSLAQLRGRVRFAADERSNSLLVYATPNNQKTVKELVDQIDVNLQPRTEYRIVPLKYADATALSDQLNQLADPNSTSNRGGFFSLFQPQSSGSQQRNQFQFKSVPDVRTNSIIVTVPVDAADTLTDLIMKLDRPSEVNAVVQVYQLKNAIASEVATTLRSLFQGTTQGGGLGFGLFGGGGRAQIPPNSPLDLLRQVTIVPNDQTNQLVISGPAQTFPVIEKLLSDGDGLDRKLPQVFIEVVIADITLDETTKFGIEWNAIRGISSAAQNFGLTSPTSDNSGFRYSVLSKNIQATLQALKTDDKIKIVSTPHVLVTDNSPALISIGESIPYAGDTTVSNGQVTSSTQFQDVAITLNVTPRISPGSHILMDIDQVVNSLIGFINISPNQVAPRTTSRRAGTTVIVENDQTVVLGGIISNNDNRQVQKIPILGDIPLIGQLFRNTVHQKSRTELVVFLTPHIVSDRTDADYVREYERSRLRVDPLKLLDAPLARPLDIKPEDIRRYRDDAGKKKR